MATLAYTSAIQSRISYLLRMGAYSSLTADEKALIDNTWSSGALSGGMALDALTQIQQVGQYFWLGTPATVPSEWESLLVWKTVWLCAPAMCPDRINQYREPYYAATMAAYNALNRNDVTSDPGATPEASTLTILNIRKYVLAGCIRRPGQWKTVEGARVLNPPQVPDIVQIDSCIHEVIVDLWGRADWPFKRRKVQLAIASDGTVTHPSLSGETFRSVATRRFYFDDSTSAVPYYMEWADGDTMAALRAERVANTTTGRPRYFRFEEKSGTVTWDFYPSPDAAYTAQGEVYTAGPVLASLSDTTTAMARFPVEFRPTIKNRVYGKVLLLMGDPLGDKLVNQTDDDINTLLPRYADVGRQDDTQERRDVYGDYGRFQHDDGVFGGNL